MSDNQEKPHSNAVSSADEWRAYQQRKKEQAATGAGVEAEPPAKAPATPSQAVQPQPKQYSRFRVEQDEGGHFWRVGDRVYVTKDEAEKAALDARSKRFSVIAMVVLFALVALGVTQCTSYLANREPSPEEQASMNEIKRNRVARELVQAQLKDPSSAQFRNQRGLCGEVNSKNSFGAYGGYQRFVAAGEGLVAFETAMPADVFAGIWSEICRQQ